MYGHLRDNWASRALPNQRMKLSRRGGHLWWNAQGKSFFLIVAIAQLMRDSLGRAGPARSPSVQLTQASAHRIALAGALWALVGCGSRAPSPEPNRNVGIDTDIRSFQVDTGYGTLSFRGRIDRSDRGTVYVYTVHLDVTFHPGARFNRTAVADLRECRLVATVPRDGGGPWDALADESRPISVRLVQDGQAAQLPELTFRLAKDIVARARHVGLAVTDGHMMWPIAVDLQ